MLTAEVEHDVVTGPAGVLATASFGISETHAAHIMGILRSTLYSRKALAVLREYGTNGWDEHRESGQPDRPIKVVMPTVLKPTLLIRDFGRGLSEHDVLHIYTQYGESTKRSSNTATGMLGIGCLLAGQPIVTREGVKAVEDVRVGDWVLTHKGRFRQVTGGMSRPYQGRGYDIHLSQGGKPLSLTEEHPILVSDSEGCLSWQLPGQIKTGYRSATKGIQAWNSYAVLPATLETTTTTLKVLEYLGDSFSEEGGVLTRKMSWKALHPRSNEPFTNTRTTIWPGFPQSLDLDDQDLGWLLGIFAAEGSTTSKQVTFSLHADETDLASAIQKHLEKYFGVKSSLFPRPERNLLEVVCHHPALAALLGNLCGYGAHNKRVPALVMQGPMAIRQGFLEGVFDGDGSPTRPRFTFGVASPDLAWGVRTLMSVLHDKWGTVGTLEDYPGRWCIQFNRHARWSYSMRLGDHLLRPIKDVKEINLDTTVFNFSVDEDESYVSDFILHNCKAGFCYSDSFTVTSWHGGMKSVYAAVIDKSNRGRMDKVYEEPCGKETGIEIQIAVRAQDVDEFCREARDLFRYFNPQPNINIPLPSLPPGMTHGFVTNTKQSDSDSWVAVMGCIPYKIDMQQLKDPLTELGLWESLHRVFGGVYLPIGSVEFSASREELQYTEVTIKAVVAKLQDLTQEYTDDAIKALKTEGMPPWQRRAKVSFLHHTLKFPLPKEYRDLAESHVVLYSREKTPKSFLLYDSWHGLSSRVRVSLDTHLLLLDSHPTRQKALNGWKHNYAADMVVVPQEGFTLAQVQAELQQCIQDAKMDGITVTPIKNRAMWQSPRVNYRMSRPVNQKHRDQTFTLTPYFYGGPCRSREWDSAVPPTEDHIYVILREFIPVGLNQDISTMTTDRGILKDLGVAWPTIYGYKTTDKHPVTPADIEKGTPYSEWRIATLAARLTPEFQEILRNNAWANVFKDVPSDDTNYNQLHFRHQIDIIYSKLMQDLGAKHALTRYFGRHLECTVLHQKADETQVKLAIRLDNAIKHESRRDGPQEWMTRLVNAYPMITLIPEPARLAYLGTHYPLLVDYIKSQDSLKNKGSIPDPQA